MSDTTEKNCREYFGERLKSLRAEKGISQEALAKDLGISKGSLGFYETCKNTPDIEVLNAVSDYFKVSFDYLLGRTEVKTSEIELKSICEYTGLSEQAVNNIVKLYKFHIEDKENEFMTLFAFVNAFLSNFNYLKGVSGMGADYVNKFNEINNGIIELENTPIEFKIKKADELHFELSENLQFKKWRATSAFECIVTEICKDYMKQKEGKKDG